MKPNILFIMSDDHASNAISSYQSILANVAPTPHIDRIAEQGIRLDNCHCVNSICTPSRANILTGQHSHINQVRTLADSLDTDYKILPHYLQEAGYETGLIGKWHLHGEPQGFDQWIILPGQGEYFNPFFNYKDAHDRHPGTEKTLDDYEGYHSGEGLQYQFGHPAQIKGYVSDIITDLTIDWLKERKQEQPFFLCCHHKAPHDFFGYPEHLAEFLEESDLPEPETLFEDVEVLNEISRKYGTTVSQRWEPRNAVQHLINGDLPQYGPISFEGLNEEERTKKAYQLYIKAYLRAVRGVDDNVGRLMDYLEESGLAENTLVIYTSDQGMMLGEHDKIDKRWIFEESQRMPFLAKLPGLIPARSESSALVDNTDFMPTLLDLAGANIPENVQGKSFLDELKFPGGTGKHAVYYRYWMHMAHHWVPAHYGIRTQKYKLVFFYGMQLDAKGCPKEGQWSENTDPGFELYDLENDPLETTNLAHEPANQNTLIELKHQLLELKRVVGDTDIKFPELLALQNKYFS
ncbi:MAG: sulfatase [Lentisphaeria bacterium]|nr:sulfatase [Lentisphaeria bacterium]